MNLFTIYQTKRWCFFLILYCIPWENCWHLCLTQMGCNVIICFFTFFFYKCWNTFRLFSETLMTSIPLSTLSPVSSSFLLILLFCFPFFHKLSLSLYLNIHHCSTSIFGCHASLPGGFVLHSQANALLLWFDCYADVYPCKLKPAQLRQRVSSGENHVYSFQIQCTYYSVMHPIKCIQNWKAWKCYCVLSSKIKH